MDLNNPVLCQVDFSTNQATSIRTIRVTEGNNIITRTSHLASNLSASDQADHIDTNDLVQSPFQQSSTSEQVPFENNHVSMANTLEEDIEADSSTAETVGVTSRAIAIHRSNNHNAKKSKNSASECFKDVLRRAGVIFRLLEENWASPTPRLKATQIFYENRTFALLTCRVRSSISLRSNGTLTVVPYFATFWQTSKNPPRAICITSYADCQSSNVFKYTSSCSCNPTFVQSESDGSECEHLRSFFEQSTILDQIASVLHEYTFHGTASRFFGIETQENTVFPMVQLEQHLSHKFSSNSRNTCNWKFYVQFDTERLRFVPLVSQKHKSVQCLFCRTHRSRRGPCHHEQKWEQFMFTDASTQNEENNNFQEDESDYDDDTEVMNFEDSFPDTEGDEDSSSNSMSQKYCVPSISLPLMPCNAIRSQIRMMADVFEQNEGKSCYFLQDKFGYCRKCGFGRKGIVLEDGSITKRKTKLYTLTQQVQLIQVEDWSCPTCSEKNYFSGIGYAIFPVRKTYCFTYELLYYFVQNVCRLGISFRAQYESYNMMRISESSRAHFDNFSTTAFTMEPEHSLSGRRRCAEAFSKFIACIDSNCASTKALYTCKNCEVDLTPAEKISFGFSDNEECPKRFKAMVIDGTNSGTLDKNPNYHREQEFLSVQTKTRKHNRFITSRVFQQALRLIIKLIRNRLRFIIKHRKTLPPGSKYLSFILPVFGDRHRKLEKNIRLSKDAVSCLRLILNQEKCVCEEDPSQRSSSISNGRGLRSQHSQRCRKISKGFSSSVSGVDVLRFLRAGITMSYRTVELGNLQSGSDTDSDEDFTITGMDNDYLSEEQQSESSTDHFLEDIEENELQQLVRSSTMSDEEERQNNEIEQHLQSDMLNDINGNGKAWFVTLKFENPIKCSQVIESYLDVLQSMLLDNVSVQYLRPTSNILDMKIKQVGFSSYLALRNRILFDENGGYSQKEHVLGFDAIILHEEIAESVDKFADCDHTQHSHVKHFACENCTQSLVRKNYLLQGINPIYSRFLDQVLLNIKYMGSNTSSLLSDFSSALVEHIQRAKKYFDILIKHLSPECKKYWNEFANPKVKPIPQTIVQDVANQTNGESHSIDNSMNDIEPQAPRISTNNYSITTGISFPGRPCYRPLFKFDKQEDKHCGKRYPASSTHSPGVLVAMCTCSNPKLIGYIVMTRAESTSLALSSMVMHFQLPPAVILYDNACNTLAAALLRLPWILLFCFIIVDRFHYKGHTCSSFFDANSYRQLDDVRTSAAEAVNAKIKKALYHMRFLTGKNLVYYLNIRFALLNLAAFYYEETCSRDIEDADLATFFTKRFKCSCHFCSIEQQITAHSNSDSDSIHSNPDSATEMEEND